MGRPGFQFLRPGRFQVRISKKLAEATHSMVRRIDAMVLLGAEHLWRRNQSRDGVQ